jgi:hypothetical protein
MLQDTNRTVVYRDGKGQSEARRIRISGGQSPSLGTMVEVTPPITDGEDQAPETTTFGFMSDGSVHIGRPGEPLAEIVRSPADLVVPDVETIQSEGAPELQPIHAWALEQVKQPVFAGGAD